MTRIKMPALKDPRIGARLVLGVLLAGNLVAAVIAFKPFGGSADDLRRQQGQLRQQLSALEGRLQKSKVVVSKVEQARKEGDQFLAKYVTDRRTTMSVLTEEVTRISKDAGVTDKGSTTMLEPVEGSDTLYRMTISAGYEGTYANLTKLVNLIDKSQRFLIIESMVATPQQGSQKISVSLKLDTFIRDETGSTT